MPSVDRRTRSDSVSPVEQAVGFEARVPYCDYRLVEYVWNIPWEMITVGKMEKGILRQALGRVLPDDVRSRRKDSGFPLVQNPVYVEKVRKWMLQILGDPNAPILPFLNVDALRHLAEGKVPVPEMFALYLYERVIQTNAWFQDYQVSVHS